MKSSNSSLKHKLFSLVLAVCLLVMAVPLAMVASPPQVVLAGANPPQVSTKTPAANAIDVSKSANIVAQFDQNINSGTVSADIFNVDGSMSGKIAGGYNTNGSIITFNPTSDFKLGETVTVTLTTGIENSELTAYMESPVT